MFILNYNLPVTLAKICYDVSVAKEMKNNGFNAMQILEEKCTLYLVSEKKIYEFQTNNNHKLTTGDTVLIYENGYVRKLFDCTEFSQTLITTNRCSSNCVMCPYSSKQRQQSEHQDLNLLLKQIDYLPEKTEHLVVTGGEPTLIGYGFFQVMKKIRERFPDIVCLLLTNGRTFANHKTVQLAIETFPALTQIAIPIHSANSALHDAITQSEGSFHQTLNAIKRLLAEGYYIEIRVVVFQYNIDSMDAIADMIIKTIPNVSLVNFMAAEMCGNAAINSDIVWINYNDAFMKCESAIEKLITSGIDVGVYNFPLCSVPIRFHGIYKRSISGYKVRYAEKCESCVKKAICGGFFASSLKYAKDDVVPYV